VAYRTGSMASVRRPCWAPATPALAAECLRPGGRELLLILRAAIPEARPGYEDADARNQDALPGRMIEGPRARTSCSAAGP